MPSGLGSRKDTDKIMPLTGGRRLSFLPVLEYL